MNCTRCCPPPCPQGGPQSLQPRPGLRQGQDDGTSWSNITIHVGHAQLYRHRPHQRHQLHLQDRPWPRLRRLQQRDAGGRHALSQQRGGHDGDPHHCQHTAAWRYKYTSLTPAGTCSPEIPAGTTTASLTALAGNTRYTFKAYSHSGCSTEITSDSTDADFLTKPAKPSKPTATAGAGSGTLTLAATLTGGSGTLEKWQCTTDNGTSWKDVTTATGNTLNVVISTQSNGTSCTFKVRAVNATGTGPASQAAAAATPINKNLTASDATDISLKLTITNHSGDWYYKYTNPGSGTYSTTVAAGTATATGLTPNTTYTFKAYSDSSCTTELATATAKSTLALTVSAPSDTSRSDVSLTLTITNYSGSWYYKYTTPTGGQCSSAGSGSSTTVSVLTANTTYIFTAYSNGNSTTELATAASFTTQPGIPPMLYLKEESGLIKVWWQAPAGATTARLQRSQTNGNWNSTVSGEIGAGEDIAQSSGLQNGTMY